MWWGCKHQEHRDCFEILIIQIQWSLREKKVNLYYIKDPVTEKQKLLSKTWYTQTSLVVQWLRLFLRVKGVQTGSLVKELRSNMKVKVKVTQSCPILCNPMAYAVHGILQVRILEWVAFPFSRGSSQPRCWTQVSCIERGFFTSWAMREDPTCLGAKITKHKTKAIL